MRTRHTVSIKTFSNTLTGETKTLTTNLIASNRVDFQKWEQLDKDIRAVKTMRYKSSKNLHKVVAFNYAVYGE